MRVPAANPIAADKVALGRRLFFDPRLSADGSTSCSGCHDPRHGYTVGAAVSVGAFGEKQMRACPSLINAGYQKAFFWEGSAGTLEQAVRGVWTYVLVPPGEGRPSPQEVAARVAMLPEYRPAFQAAFGREGGVDEIVMALASFLRTLVPSGSPWVRFYEGDSKALPESAQRGWEVFDGKARCTNCHSGVLLTDRLFHNIGAGKKTGDIDGRFVMTRDERDRGAFKTPTLLNVGRSAPYFHDNSVPTLEEAVDRMLAGGFPGGRWPIDSQLRGVELTAEERRDLLAFLRALDADPAGVSID